MKYKIGFSTRCLPYDYWLEHLPEEFDTVELNRPNSNSNYTRERVEEIREACKGLDLSVHTLTSGEFLEDGALPEAEYCMLKSEIIFCKKISAKELIFHIDKEDLSAKDIQKIKDLFELATQNKIQLILENDKRSTLDAFQAIFKEIPSLKMNLDIGHLNRMLYNKTISSFEEFIEPLKDRIIYIHIHNNYHEYDDHAGLDKGNLDYEKVLSLVDLNKVKKFILEMRELDDVLKSRNILEEVLGRLRVCE